MSENIKTRKYYRVHNGTDWDRMHFVTDANSVDANDGDNMETKVGAIKGITTSTEVTEEGYAADATTVAALNSSLGGLKFGVDSSGNYGYYKAGADSVTPFKTTKVISLGTGTSFNVTAYEGYKNFTTSNFLYKLVKPSSDLTTSATTAHNGQNTATSGTVTTTVSESYSNGVYKVTISEKLTVQPWANDAASKSRNLTVKAYLILN